MHSPIRIKCEEDAPDLALIPGHGISRPVALLPAPRPPSPAPIQYDADNARVRALQMVNELAGRVNTLPLGSNLRKDEFEKTIERLRALAETPGKTLIAFCGYTGVGKSTLINALLGLGEDVVPTSAIQACTAVVTEVAYKPDAGLRAEIEYLTAAEWKEEVDILLGDIRDPLSSEDTDEVEVARAKVRVVYPSVSTDELATMTAGELMARNSALSIILGNTMRIVDNDPARFSQELSRYLEGQEGFNPATNAEPGNASPAYWPLIRQVRIFVHSPVLASGAVLVDLPGVGDSNAARNRVAQSFMSRADRFFVVAPISRAVSDKVAMGLLGAAFKSQLKMDGKYHADAITFVATKCDDVPCQEIIRNLSLGQDADLKSKQSRIREATDNVKKWTQTKEKLESDVQMLEERLQCGAMDQEVPRASASSTSASSAGMAVVQHRVGMSTTHSDSGLKRPSRNEEELHVSSKKQRVDHSSSSPARSQDEDELLAAMRKLKLADMSMKIAQKKLEDANEELTAFCATKRSQWATLKLQAHFRAGLEEMEVDDIVNDQSAPGHIDGDLTVFTVSARAQMQIEGYVEVGKEQTVNSARDTGIPELRQWIDTITRPTRDRVAERLLLQTDDFVRCIETWIDGIPGVSLADREALMARWRSKKTRSPQTAGDEDEDTPYREVLKLRYRLSPATAIIPALLQAFQDVVDGLTNDISARFAKGLGDKCRASANAAAADVIKASEDFTAKLHHATYRATLRRKGVYKENLNALLAVPFTRRIASTWSDVFAANMLKTLEQRAAAHVERVLGQVVDSAPDYIHARAREVMRSTLASARRDLRGVQASVRKALDAFKVDLGSSLSPLVQAQLQKGYEDALLEVGRGSYKRQKAVFNSYLESKKRTLFAETAATLEAQLEEAGDVVGDTLDKALENVARKVEVNISILWEGCPLEGEEDNKARVATKTLLKDTAEEIDRWLDAKKAYDAARAGAAR